MDELISVGQSVEIKQRPDVVEKFYQLVCHDDDDDDDDDDEDDADDDDDDDDD